MLRTLFIKCSHQPHYSFNSIFYLLWSILWTLFYFFCIPAGILSLSLCCKTAFSSIMNLSVCFEHSLGFIVSYLFCFFPFCLWITSIVWISYDCLHTTDLNLVFISLISVSVRTVCILLVRLSFWTTHIHPQYLRHNFLDFCWINTSDISCILLNCLYPSSFIESFCDILFFLSQFNSSF